MEKDKQLISRRDFLKLGPLLLTAAGVAYIENKYDPISELLEPSTAHAKVEVPTDGETGPPRDALADLFEGTEKLLTTVPFMNIYVDKTTSTGEWVNPIELVVQDEARMHTIHGEIIRQVVSHSGQNIDTTSIDNCLNDIRRKQQSGEEIKIPYVDIENGLPVQKEAILGHVSFTGSEATNDLKFDPDGVGFVYHHLIKDRNKINQSDIKPRYAIGNNNKDTGNIQTYLEYAFRQEQKAFHVYGISWTHPTYLIDPEFEYTFAYTDKQSREENILTSNMLAQQAIWTVSANKQIQTLSLPPHLRVVSNLNSYNFSGQFSPIMEHWANTIINGQNVWSHYLNYVEPKG